MAIEDNNPERRNLVITSLGFILYYLGGGEVVDGVLSIQAVNLKFHNSFVLAITPWVMLLWFLWRYWQDHRGRAFDQFRKDAYSYVPHEFLTEYISLTTGLKPGEKDFYINPSFNLRKNEWGVTFKRIHKTIYKEDGITPNTFEQGKTEFIPFKGSKCFWYKFKLYTKAFFEKPGFTSLLSPYLFFFTAILIPFYQTYN